MMIKEKEKMKTKKEKRRKKKKKKKYFECTLIGVNYVETVLLQFSFVLY